MTTSTSTPIIKNKQIQKHEEAAKKMFSKEAEKQAKAYKEKGLSSTARLVVDLIKATGSIDQGIHVDVGCGSGKICFELLKNGARRTLGIDLADEAIAKAQQLAEEFGFSTQAEFMTGSFIDVELNLDEKVQSVILHRVLCCHPNAKGILEKTVSLHPEHILITLPTDNPILRTLHAPIGMLTRIFTKGFQAQLHRHDFIHSYLNEQGYELAFTNKKFPWVTFHFSKRS